MDAVQDAVCNGDPLSVTVTVKLESPVPVGVPDMMPALDSVRPAGNAPELRDHVYPGVPPLAAKAAEYPVPSSPAASEVVVIASLVAVTLMERLTVCVCAGDPLSATSTVKFAEPLEVGVPEITPAEERARPAGKLPEEIDQLYAGVPPLAASVAL